MQVRRFWIILLAAGPALAAVVMIEVARQSGTNVLVPFLLIFATVVFAGAVGGRWSGLLAGAAASAFIVHAYLDGFGPKTLTGGLFQVFLGTTLVTGAGILLGWLRDTGNARFLDAVESASRAQAQLREEMLHREARFEQALTVAKIGLWVWNYADDRMEFCSDVNAAMNGLTPAEYIESCSDTAGGLGLVHPEDRKDYAAAIDAVGTGRTITHEYRGLKKEGGTVYIRETLAPVVEDDGRVSKLFGTSVDVTDLRQTEINLRRTQQTEAIGRLTAGIAHDFNNLLAVIMGNLELMRDRIDDPETREMIAAALRASGRGATLTKQMLAFGRQSEMRPEVLNPNAVVRGMDDLFRRTLPATIKVETVLNGGAWTFRTDRTQFESALLNLVINARDAMPEGGVLTVETANVRLDEPYLDDRQENVAPGRYVMVAVSDTGTGIDGDTMDKVFEPFFTTKPPGEGSGLGLAMVYGFVKQSNGVIRIYSEAGQGTTVKMYFPEASGDTGATPEWSQERFPQRPGGTCILVVEDEEDVRTLVAAQLRAHGFEVLEAPDAEAALSVLRATDGIGLLLTDVVMPGKIQGTELAGIASAEYPGLAVVLMTGYAKSALENGDGKSRSFLKVTKPVQMDDLVRVVRRALEN